MRSVMINIDDDNNSALRCRNCQSSNIITIQNRGEVTCRSCGLVLVSKVVDERGEWRTYTDDILGGADLMKAARADVGEQSIFGLSPVITLAFDERMARRLVQPGRDAKERRVVRFLHSVRSVGELLRLPPAMIRSAQDIMSRTVFKESNIVRDKMVISGAAIYLACKVHGFPRTLDEVASVAAIDKSLLGRTQDTMSKLLELHTQVIHPSDLVPRFMSQCGAERMGYLLSDCDHICKQIIEHHKGKIWAEPSLKGACIVFTLPKNINIEN